MFRRIGFALLFFGLCAENIGLTTPWLTGPLIAPNGTVIPYGQWNIQSLVFVTTYTGTYSSHWNSVSAPQNFYSVNPQLNAFFGLTSWCDINLIPQFFWNRRFKRSKWPVGKTSLRESLIPGK